MKLNELKATEGARSTKKRIGRGLGSGNGKRWRCCYRFRRWTDSIL